MAEEKEPVVGGLSVAPLPGVAHKENLQHIYTKHPDNFVGFPKKPDKDGKTNGNTGYDLKRIRAEYLESPIIEWEAYCASRGYNPRVYTLPFRQWVRDKKMRQAWIGVRDQIENEGVTLGAHTLLKQLKAVRQIPETASRMMILLQHLIRVHTEEVIHDDILLKQAQDRRANDPTTKVEVGELRFSAGSQDLLFMSTALKQTSETLMKSLGINDSNINAAKWQELVERELGRIDGETGLGEREEFIKVELIGAKDLQASLKEALAKYLDKPGEATVIEAESAPEGLGAELSEEEREEAEQEDNEEDVH